MQPNKNIKRSSQNKKTATQRISLNISEKALAKMAALVESFAGEVGWHGTAKRLDKSSFTIEDIFVYPQIATAASIDTEQFEYEKWLMSQPDEIFTHLRMHGHSHVNFGVSPSTKDDRHREGIVEKLTGDMFYIFIIMNKSLKIHILVYDCATRLIYTANHIDLFVVIGGKKQAAKDVKSDEIKKLLSDSDIISFVKDAEKLVKTWCNISTTLERV